MKRILLVNTNTEQMPYPVPPIGINLLASVLEKTYNVQVYDGVSRGNKELQQEIKTFQPDIIGFGIRNIDNLDSRSSYYYIDAIKHTFINIARQCTDVPFVLGGSAFSLYPRVLLDYFECDFGIIGEAEESFPKFLKYFFEGLDYSQLPGLIGKNFQNDYVPLQSFENVSKLDTRINFDYYKQRGAYSIQTKRGCYHKCVYCTYPLIEGNQFRKRDPEKIVDEIEDVIDRIGPQLFEFVDSTFNDPKGYAESICNILIKRGVKSRFRTMGINPAHISEELILMMKEAGFTQIDCTPDSASPEMIKNFKKNFSLDQLVNAANLLKKYDFPTMWFFIVSGPGETVDTLKETFSFIEKYIDPLHMVHITSGIRIFPNTELQRIAIDENIITADCNLLQPAFYFSPKLSDKVLKKELMHFAKHNLNFVPANESKPSPEMMKEAMDRRRKNNLEEPMFKTLLRIRREWVHSGKIVVGE